MEDQPQNLSQYVKTEDRTPIETEQSQNFLDRYLSFENQTWTIINSCVESPTYNQRRPLFQLITTSLRNNSVLLTKTMSNDSTMIRLSKMFTALSEYSDETLQSEIRSIVRNNHLVCKNQLREKGLVNPEIAEAYFDILFSSMNNEDNRRWGLEQLYQNFDVIENLVNVQPNLAIDVLGKINGYENDLIGYDYEYTPSDRAKVVLKSIISKKYIENPEEAFLYIDRLNRQNKLQYVANDWQEFAIELLARFNINTEKILQVWDITTEVQGRSIISENMEVMNNLEALRPGSVEYLNRVQGIKNFARYSPELLIQQFDDRNKRDLPHGVLVVADSDHNGALTSLSEVWDSFNNQLEKRYRMRIVECGSTIDVARKMITLDRRFGSENKFSFAIIAGHGTEDSIELSEGIINSSIRKKDFNKPGFQRTKQFFVDKPSFLFASCSTGSEDGIAQKISEVFHATVIAPKVSTQMHDIKVKFLEDGTFDMVPTYAQGGGFTFEPTATTSIMQKFENGELIQ